MNVGIYLRLRFEGLMLAERMEKTLSILAELSQEELEGENSVEKFKEKIIQDVKQKYQQVIITDIRFLEFCLISDPETVAFLKNFLKNFSQMKISLGEKFGSMPVGSETKN